MQVPTIHSNGTSRELLVESLCKASCDLDVAYQSLKETAPNGRDFYPQGPQAFEQARQEHMSRLARLDAVKNEIDELTIAIDRGDS